MVESYGSFLPFLESLSIRVLLFNESGTLLFASESARALVTETCVETIAPSLLKDLLSYSVSPCHSLSLFEDIVNRNYQHSHFALKFAESEKETFLHLELSHCVLGYDTCILGLLNDVTSEKQEEATLLAAKENISAQLQTLQRKLLSVLKENDDFQRGVQDLRNIVLLLQTQIIEAGMSVGEDIEASLQASQFMASSPVVSSSNNLQSLGAFDHLPAVRPYDFRPYSPALQFDYNVPFTFPGEQETADDLSNSRSRGDSYSLVPVGVSGHLDKAAKDSNMRQIDYDNLLDKAKHQKAKLQRVEQDFAACQVQFDKLTKDAAVQEGLLVEDAKPLHDVLRRTDPMENAFEDSATQKQQHDQLVNDGMVQQVQFMLLETSASQKLECDKLVIDAGFQRAQLDKMINDSAAQKLEYDELLENATSQKAQYDKILQDSAAEKMEHKKVILNASMQKAQYDEVVRGSIVQKVEYNQLKSDFDRMVRDSTAQKALFDKFVEDSTVQKMQYDELLLESTMQKAQLDKVVEDSAAQKADFGKLMIDACVQKAQLDKLIEDSAAQKVEHDRLVDDAQAQKIEYDKLLEETTTQKAKLDKVAVDSTAQKTEYDQVLLNSTIQKAEFDKVVQDSALQKVDKLIDNSTLQKTEYDHVLLGATVQKTQFDKVLDKLIHDSTAQKTEYDRLLLTSTIQKAQFDKVVQDSVHQKLEHDKVVEDSTIQKAQFDKVLQDSALQKSEYDKLIEDSTIQKAQFDKVLEDSTLQKSEFDKLIEDSAAQKTEYDHLLINSTVQKAQFDKVVQDSALQKSEYDKLIEDSTIQKTQFDKVVEDSTLQKSEYDKLIEDAAAQKTEYDHLMINSTVQKAQFDKVVQDSALQKSEYDRLIEDSTAQKAQFDKVLEDSTVQKAQFDKVLHDSTVQKAQFDKVLEDSAIQKSEYDKLVEDSTIQKAQFDKVVQDSVMQKSEFDKLIEDSAAQKTEYDQVLINSTVQKAQFDKVVQDSALQKVEFDHLLHTSTIHKAQLDKVVEDSTLQKFEFDKLIDNSTAQKTEYDQLLLSSTTQKAQFDKIVEDSAIQKAEFDKLVEDSAVHKVEYDKLLDHATFQKAQFDKVIEDSAAQKVEFDFVLESAIMQKAQLDKVVEDFVAQKVEFDKVLDDATIQKAQFDKVVEDSTVQKAEFDKLAGDAAVQKGQLDKIAEDFTVQKCEYDKLLDDATVQKVQFDKVTVDAAVQKIEFDKLLDDANLHKTLLDKVVEDSAVQKSELDKLTEDFAGQKCDYDKLLVDATAQKNEFDKLLVDSAEQKAHFDKVVVDVSEEVFKARESASAFKARADDLEVQNEEQNASITRQQSAFNKLLCDASELKSAFDMQKGSLDHLEGKHAVLYEEKVNADIKRQQLQEQVAKAQVDLQSLNNILVNERITNQKIQSDLQKQQAVLQAELQLAISNYKPKAHINAGTPADKLLSMMNELLDGVIPSIQDILYMQNAVLESHDIYRPMNLRKQLLNTENLGEDVGRALLKQLGTDGESETVLHVEGAGRGAAARNRSSEPETGPGSAATEFSSLHSSLQTIIGTQLNSERTELQRTSSSAACVNFWREQCGTSKGSWKRSPFAKGHAEDETDSSETRQTTPHYRVPTSIMPEVERTLMGAHQWHFDVFQLASASNGRSLSVLAFYLFHASGLISKYSMKPLLLARYLQAVEEGYPQNPYHNSVHATSVLHMMHLMLHRGGMVPCYCDSLMLVACYLAAVVHDFEHFGLTNDFLINSSNELAVRYNDRSPMENHHLAAAFSLLMDPHYNFLSALPKADYDKLRRLVIELVLATDMKQHFSIVSHFATVHRLTPIGSSSSTGRGAVSDSTCSIDSCSSGRLSGFASRSGTDYGNQKLLVPIDETERLLSLQVALKCSDLGHMAAQPALHRRWVGALEEEFFRQGDVEKELGLPQSPLFDRSKQGISKSQIGFFDIVVIPLFHNFTNVFVSAKPVLTYVMRNYKHWTELQRKA